jgi:hypothetical protein
MLPHIRAVMCRIDIFLLHSWHLTDVMLLARAEQQNRRHADYGSALPRSKSHNAQGE